MWGSWSRDRWTGGGVRDLQRSRVAPDELHRYLAHGDIAKYNMVVTSDGVKFIEFGKSVLVRT